MRYIFLTLIGSIAANYLFQAFGDQLWAVAFERSWFQVSFALAINIVMMTNRLELK